jgi:DNA-binding MarR family transcriptional regulator
MMALWEKDLLTMGELSKNTSMDKGFLTTTIKRLADQKIITLKTDAKDSRKKIVKLTAKGTKLKVKAEKIPEMLICKVSECLKSEINFEEFKKSLDILNSAIKDIK